MSLDILFMHLFHARASLLNIFHKHIYFNVNTLCNHASCMMMPWGFIGVDNYVNESSYKEENLK